MPLDAAAEPRRYLRTKNTARPTTARPAIPPTTPPAMGPALDFLVPKLELSPVAVGVPVPLSVVVNGEASVLVLDPVVVVLEMGSALDSGRSG